jgi:pyruvate carboxylase
VKVLKTGMAVTPTRPRAQEDNPAHIGAAMSGLVVTVMVQADQHVAKGDPLLSIEAMKMKCSLWLSAPGPLPKCVCSRVIEYSRVTCS